MHKLSHLHMKNVYLFDNFQLLEIKEIFKKTVPLDTSELRFRSVQGFPPPYLHKEPG